MLIDQFSEKRINSDDVWNLIDRTETRHEKPTISSRSTIG